MSDYTSHLKAQPAKILHSNEDQEINVSSYASSFVNTLKGYVQLNSSEDQEMLHYADESPSSFCSKLCFVFSIQQNYFKFGIFLTLGIVFFALSLMFLPIFWLSPKKFVSVFSLGSFFSIFSFVFFYGPKEFFSMIFSKERQGYSLIYFCSTFIGIYYSFNPTFYLLSLFCSIIQFIVTVIFVLSFIPGGKSGIAFILSMLTGPFKKLFNK